MAYPEAASLRDALRLGDWAVARAILDAQAPAARTALMRTVEQTKRADSVLERALADDPADATATALLGLHRIAAAWRVRTAASARHVSRRRFARFHAGLAEAENILTVGTSHHPHDPALWTAALSTARGLELGLHTAHERYARLAEIDPHHLPGQANMLQQLAPKWGGTWADMHAFSQEAMRNAPQGAPNAVLVAEAHLEVFVATGRSYMRSPHVRDALAEAADHSVLNPGYRRDIGWVRTTNTFALAFALAGDRQSAAAMFAELGPYAAHYPWGYQGDEVAAFRRARAQAYGWTGSAVMDRLLAVTGSAGRRGALGLLTLAWR